MNEWQGLALGKGRRFAIVASRFNGRLVDALVEGAEDCLRRHGVEERDIELARVPGAWEIPLVLDEMARSGRFAAAIALGVVIRGETSHYEIVAGECSRGCAAVAAEHRFPVGFGVLTCEGSDQAAARAGGKLGNKGWDAAAAALEMADLLWRLRQDSSRPGGK
jgi:6,7-dimethyl-8-ribityllumazine synthase